MCGAESREDRCERVNVTFKEEKKRSEEEWYREDSTFNQDSYSTVHSGFTAKEVKRKTKEKEKKKRTTPYY